MEREMGFQYGDELQAHVTAPLLAAAPYRAANLVNDYGMKEQGETGDATHDNHPQGSDMWMLSGRTEDFEIIFDFQGFYPLGNGACPASGGPCGMSAARPHAPTRISPAGPST